ncbi:MAG: DUF1810 domain-containing protein [Methyloligellaceae bacterium]
MNDPFNLTRFIEAQDPVYERVCLELSQGKKVSHWMWFIFPQIQGLGRTSTAKKYAISSLEEAKDYLQHPVLGERLLECTDLVIQISKRNIEDIFYNPDNLKFHSSMTLFVLAANEKHIFTQALDKYFDGELDSATLKILDL